MNCAYCGAGWAIVVKYDRLKDERKYKCPICGKIFYTVEQIKRITKVDFMEIVNGVKERGKDG